MVVLNFVTVQQILVCGTGITYNWIYIFSSEKLSITKISFKYKIRCICGQNIWLPIRGNSKDPKTSSEQRIATIA